jgi:hypothetical protein
VGFLGFEESSAEFELFSRQAESFSTSVKVTNAVVVPPGWKGWTTYRVLGANVTGSAYVTDGIHLIQVKGIDLSFPGYMAPGETDSRIRYIGNRKPMTDDDISNYCHPVTGQTATVRRARAAAAAGSFKLTLCDGADCTTQRVNGTPPPPIRRATATIKARGRIYAKGTVTRGRIRLDTRRRMTSGGTYTLFINEPPMVKTRHERHHVRTHVPITIP